jgi:hypothetical protein
MRELAALAGIVVLAWPLGAAPSPAASGAGLAQQLLKSCIDSPSREAMAKLAAAVGATPFSDARTKRELGPQEASIERDDLTHPDEAQRTETTVIAFQGWDLPGPSAGTIEYDEEVTRIARVEVKSGEPITPWRQQTLRECVIAAPVADARDIFELYEKLQSASYGVLLSADRRHLSVFTFDPDAYDIELSFELDAPLAGLPPDTQHSGYSRLDIPDGGPQFIGGGGPEVPSVRITRAALLAGLAHPAQMTFANNAIAPTVQRLTTLGP